MNAELKCPECGAPLQLRGGKYGLFYGCKTWQTTGCEGGISAHPNGTPMGVPGNKATRQARRMTHALFDRLWRFAPTQRQQKRKRNAAYKWLRRELGLTKEECHIGNFSIEQCERVQQLVQRRLEDRLQEERYSMRPFYQ